jgi:hypothetical protein
VATEKPAETAERHPLLPQMDRNLKQLTNMQEQTKCFEIALIFHDQSPSNRLRG